MYGSRHLLDCGGPILSPILGIIASQNYPRITNSYESIATVTVGSGGAADIDFTSIPSTFKHLQIRQLNLNSAASQTIFIRLNGDTGSNYARHQVGGAGASTFASGESSQTAGFIGIGSGSTSSSFVGALVTDILDYTNTNKNTTVRAFGGTDTNGAGQIKLCSTLWLNTSAVTSILIYPDSGNFAQYSSFALYGIK
jgi:hypothetical protein